MRVIVFGGSRGLGKQAVVRALHHGHRVTAMARNPERIGVSHERLRLVRGNATSAAEVSAAMQKQQAAIVALGLPTRKAMGFGRDKTLSVGTRNIAAAASRHRVSRVLAVTALGAGDSVRQIGLLYRIAMRLVLGYQCREKDLQEAILADSDLDWTVVRPAAMTNGPPTAALLADPSQSYGLFTHVARADVAEWMVRSLKDQSTYRRAIVVSYPRQGFRDFIDYLRHWR